MRVTSHAGMLFISLYQVTNYPPGMKKVPRKLAIVRANRYMVDHVDYLIAYAWHPASNARDLLRYAEQQSKYTQITVTNISYTGLD